MPAINRRNRSSPTQKPPSTAQDECVKLVSAVGNKLGKVRLLGRANAEGASLAQVTLATGEYIDCTLPRELQQQLLFRGSGFFVLAPATAAAETEPAVDSEASVRPVFDVVYVLADEDPPVLARQGLWPTEFEAEGIDGISNVQKIDLQKCERIAPPVEDAQLSKPFYDSDDDDGDHALGCACCPGGRKVVFRVY